MKLLQLRSSDGKVFLAPTVDHRCDAEAPPLETKVPSRVLSRVLTYWVKHAMAPPGADLRAWDTDFLISLFDDNMALEATIAANALGLVELSQLLSDLALYRTTTGGAIYSDIHSALHDIWKSRSGARPSEERRRVVRAVVARRRDRRVDPICRRPRAPRTAAA